MNKDEIAKAINVAAQARIARLFDVLCTEVTHPDDKDSAATRFMNGIRLINTARTVAMTALDEGGDQS